LSVGRESFSSVQFTFQQTVLEVVSVGFLEELSLETGSKLLATYRWKAECGSEFQRTGAATEKLCWPSLVDLIHGTDISPHYRTSSL